MPKQPANDPGVEAVDGPTLEGEALKAAMKTQGNVQPFNPDGRNPVAPSGSDAVPPPEVPALSSDQVPPPDIRSTPPTGASEPARKRAVQHGDADRSVESLVVKDLPRGYREHIEFQPRTGCYAAGYTRRAETEAVFLGDDFRSEEEARRAVRNEASNDDAF